MPIQKFIRRTYFQQDTYIPALEFKLDYIVENMGERGLSKEAHKSGTFLICDYEMKF